VWLKVAGAAEVKIRRHIKIRADANPYDRQWWQYFSERRFRKKFGITRREAGVTPS